MFRTVICVNQSDKRIHSFDSKFSVFKTHLTAKVQMNIVRDSSAVRRHYYFFARAVGRQRALHTENSGFASQTPGRHISTFRGYRILFSIRNPYINRFTNHFSIQSEQKEIIQNVLERIDSMAVLPTGFRKEHVLRSPPYANNLACCIK
jgi:hypothetical protein